MIDILLTLRKNTNYEKNSFNLHYNFIFLLNFYIMSDIRQDRSLSPSPGPGGDEEPPLKKIKSSRKKRSWTWDFFEEVDITEQTNDKGEQLKRCKVLDNDGNKCGALYINDGSTGNAINHLLADHEITKDGKINSVSILSNFF